MVHPSPVLLRALLDERVRVGAPGDCWPCDGPEILKGGYVRLSIARQRIQAHRAMWIVTHGLIPDGLCVCHHCDNPPCCNPGHLFVGTAGDNAADRQRKGRGRGIIIGLAGRLNADKTQCPHGHAYSSENTRWRKGGGRACRTCERTRCREYQRRLRTQRKVVP